MSAFRSAHEDTPAAPERPRNAVSRWLRCLRLARVGLQPADSPLSCSSASIPGGTRLRATLVISMGCGEAVWGTGKAKCQTLALLGPTTPLDRVSSPQGVMVGLAYRVEAGAPLEEVREFGRRLVEGRVSRGPTGEEPVSLLTGSREIVANLPSGQIVGVSSMISLCGSTTNFQPSLGSRNRTRVG